MSRGLLSQFFIQNLEAEANKQLANPVSIKMIHDILSR
jgi:hypothetical protein